MNFLRKWWAGRVLLSQNICPKHMLPTKVWDFPYDFWDIDRYCDVCYRDKLNSDEIRHNAAQKKIAERIARAKEVLK